MRPSLYLSTDLKAESVEKSYLSSRSRFKMSYLRCKSISFSIISRRASSISRGRLSYRPTLWDGRSRVMFLRRLSVHGKSIYRKLEQQMSQHWNDDFDQTKSRNSVVVGKLARKIKISCDKFDLKSWSLQQWSQGQRRPLINSRGIYLLLEAESAVFIRVKEFDEAVGLTFTDSEVALVFKEAQNFKRTNEGVRVAIKSLEGRVWCKITDWAESLTSWLESSLSVTDSDQQIFKSILWFVSKHLFLSSTVWNPRVRTQSRSCIRAFFLEYCTLWF